MKIVKHIDTVKHLPRSTNPIIENLSLEWVAFEDLWVTPDQVATFDIGHLNEILENYHPALLRSSSVVIIDGHRVLWDGQHTATANWIMGMDKVPCLVTVTDTLDFKNIPSIEKFDSIQIAKLMMDLMEQNNISSIADLQNYIKTYYNYQDR